MILLVAGERLRPQREVNSAGLCRDLGDSTGAQSQTERQRLSSRGPALAIHIKEEITDPVKDDATPVILDRLKDMRVMTDDAIGSSINQAPRTAATPGINVR